MEHLEPCQEDSKVDIKRCSACEKSKDRISPRILAPLFLPFPFFIHRITETMFVKTLSAMLLIAAVAAAQSTLSADVVSTSSTKAVLATSQTRTPTGVLKYEPSTTGNAVVGAIYLLYSFVISFYVFRCKDRWALCLPIGCFLSAVGYFIRPTLDPFNLSLAAYIVQNMFVVISPATFLAFNYLLYGRMILAVDKDFGQPAFDMQALESQPSTTAEKITMLHKAGGPKTERSRYSFIPPRIVGRVFVWSDVTTFLIQVLGGSLQASGGASNPSLTQLGDRLFLVGVALQGASYILFNLLLTYAVWLVVKEGTRGSSVVNQERKVLGLDTPVFALVSGLYFSSLFIIVS